MSDDFAALDAMIDACKALGSPDLARQVAAAASPHVDAAIKVTARAGRAPDGTAWAPRKKDGAPALIHVADQIATNAVGNVVRTTLTGPAVYSNFGAGMPRRQVLPDSAASMPANVVEAATKGAREVFERITGGAR